MAIYIYIYILSKIINVINNYINDDYNRECSQTVNRLFWFAPSPRGMINDYKPNYVEGATSRWSKINPGVRVTGWVGVDVSFFMYYILIGPRVRPRRRIVITAAMDDTPRGRECDINNDSVILSMLIKIVRTRGHGATGQMILLNHNVDLFAVDWKKTTARLSSYNII